VTKTLSARVFKPHSKAQQSTAMLGEKVDQKEKQIPLPASVDSSPFSSPQDHSFYLNTLSKLFTEVQQSGLIGKSVTTRKPQQ